MTAQIKYYYGENQILIKKKKSTILSTFVSVLLQGKTLLLHLFIYIGMDSGSILLYMYSYYHLL